MREAVTAVFTHQDELFVIRRQPWLRAFPGYLAFPGGKVDREDRDGGIDHPLTVPFEPALMAALGRELREELGFDLAAALEAGEVLAIDRVGVAVTPAFERVRFRAHHFRIRLRKRPAFDPDTEEIAWSGWVERRELWRQARRGEHLMVVATRNLIAALARDPEMERVEPFNLVYEPGRELPLLELIAGIGHIPVPSNTLPPARFTNALLIGDAGAPRCLVDPSPQSEVVMERLLTTLEQSPPDLVLISHHHPDHHQYAPEIARRLRIPLGCTPDTHRRLATGFGAGYLDGVELRSLVAGEEVTRWQGRPVTCRPLPGHDDGMIGLAPEGEHWFFVADLIQTMGTVVIPEPEGDMAAYFDSLERVIGLRPAMVIPSHGMPVGGTWHLEQTLEHRRQRERQVRELHASGHSQEQMLETIYPGLDPGLRPLAAQNLRQHLRKLGHGA